jgi:tripartite-type tricarboxylate transporter receptor subunit TctC
VVFVKRIAAICARILATAFATALAASLAMALSGAGAKAQGTSFPDHPIRLIVAFPAGATNDVVARLLGDQMGAILGQPVIIDNRPGANGFIGAELVKHAAPDGYTLLQGNTSILGINPSLFKSLPYDPVNDFEPISVVASSPSVIIINPTLKVRTLAELIAYAKTNPNQLSYASAGSGTPMHLSAELLKAQTGAQIISVPYKGAAPAVSDVLAGHVLVMVDNVPSVLAHIRAGSLIALATTGETRLDVLPNVPTVGEAGFGDTESSSWFGLVAPKGTPRPIIDKLANAIRQAVDKPAFRERLTELGAQAVGGTPEQMAAHIKAEIAKWGPVVEKSGAKAD